MEWVGDCYRCNGSGEIVRRAAYPMTFVGPGAVPDDTPGVVGETCDNCGGTGGVTDTAPKMRAKTLHKETTDV